MVRELACGGEGGVDTRGLGQELERGFPILRMPFYTIGIFRVCVDYI